MFAIQWPFTTPRALRALALAAFLAVGLAACGDGENGDGGGEATMEEEGDDDME